MKRICLPLLTLTLLFALLAWPVAALAQGADTVQPTPKNVEIKIGSTVYDDTHYGMLYEEGTPISAYFEWDVEDRKALVNPFVFSLGDFKVGYDFGGGLVHNQFGALVGTWVVARSAGPNGEDQIIFHFKEEFAEADASGRSFWVRLDGELPIDPAENHGKDIFDFKIGEETVGLSLRNVGGGLDIVKTVKTNTKQEQSNRYDYEGTVGADGKLRYDVTLTVTVTAGYVDSIHLHDQVTGGMASGAGFTGIEGLTVKFKDKDSEDATSTLVEGKDYTFKDDYKDSDPYRFDMDITGQYRKGDVITVTYTLVYDMGQNLNPGSVASRPTENTASVEGMDSNGDPVGPNKSTAAFSVPEPKLALSKTGDIGTGNDAGYVVWKFTIDSGIFTSSGASSSNSTAIANALTSILMATYGNNLQFNDVVGSGLAMPELGNNSFWTQTGANQVSIIVSKIPEYVQKGLLTIRTINDRWCIEGTYKTRITGQPAWNPETKQYEYINTMTAASGTDEVTTTGPIGVPGYILEKERTESKPTLDDNGNAVMKWRLITWVPVGNFAPFYISDDPQDDFKYQTGSEHIFRTRSIRIYWSNSKTTVTTTPAYELSIDQESWLTLEESAAGFKLQISNPNNQYNGKYLFIYFETVATDLEGEDPLGGNYSWGNNAEIGDMNVDDSAKYEQNPVTKPKPNMSKNSVSVTLDEATGDYVYAWRLRNSNVPLLTRNGDGFDETWVAIGEVALEDTLPPGHALAWDSVTVTLYNRGDAAIPQTEAWLSQGLTVSEIGTTDDGRRICKITWHAPALVAPEAVIAELQAAIASNTRQLYFALEYETRLVDHNLLVDASGSTLRSRNDFTGTVDDNPVSGNATGSVTPGKFLGKSYEYQGNWVSSTMPDDDPEWMYTDGNPNIRYTLELNQARLTAGGTEGYAYLEDTLGLGLRLIEESIILRNADTGEIVRNPDYTYDAERHMLKLTIPDGTHYTLTYWAEILSDDGVTVPDDAGNKAELYLAGASQWTETTSPGGLFNNDAGAISDMFFDIIKEDKDTGAKLSGATFDLSYGQFVDGEFNVIGSKAPSAINGARTRYAFKETDAALRYVFRVTELTAPSGYVFDDAPHYFVFTAYYAGDLASLPGTVARISPNNATFTFPNTHARGSVTLVGEKTIRGRAWDDEVDTGAYEFTLEAITAGAPMPETTVVVNDDEVIQFPEIEYTQPGTYRYKITETRVDSDKAPNVVADPDAVVYVTVEVKPDNRRGLIATAHYSREENAAFEEGDVSFTFVNTFLTGGLKVTKTVTGKDGDPSADFTFTVTLSDTGITGTYGDVAFTDGFATFTLKHSEYKTISGLPVGVSYTVTETNSEGYAVTSTGETGTIETDVTADVQFINERLTGGLKVTKTVSGTAGDPTADFTFTVTLSDTGVNGPYGDVEFANGTATFTLKHSEYKTISGLPTGVTYTVTETDNEGYTVISTGETGTIVADVTADVQFTNHQDKELTGGLKVTKTVSGTDGDQTAPFTFTVTLSDTGINGPYGDLEFTDGTVTFTLKHNESKTVLGLPVGITYTVTETDNEGYTVTSTGETGTIVADATADVRFINHRDRELTGSLKVSKTVQGTAGDPQKAFSFTVMLSDITVSGTYGDMTFTKGVATFTLRHGESKTATGLPANIRYSVSEASANQDGYTTSAVGDTGVIQDGETAAAIFINAKDEIDVPKTGDDSHPALWLMLLLASALCLAMTARRGRKAE